MDSFDFNLHQAILSELAVSWSQGQESTGRSCQDEDDSILERFGFNDDEEDPDTTLSGKQSLSLARCNALIALARYTEAQRSTNDGASGKHVQVVLSMLARLHDISIERCLGAQGRTARWLISDQLAYALAKAAISICTANAQGSKDIIASLFQTYADLKEALGSADVTRLVEHLLPCIHGIYRAFATCQSVWNAGYLELGLPALEPLETSNHNYVKEVLQGSFTHSSSEGRHVSVILARYEVENTPMSAELVDKCDAGILQAMTCGVLVKKPQSLDDNWRQVVSGHVASEDSELDSALSASILQSTNFQLRKNLASLERDEEIAPENYELDIVAANLISTTVLCIATSLDSDHLSLLHMLLSDRSTVYAEPIQRAALQSIDALVHSYPDLAEPSITHLRRFITAPIPILASDATAASSVLVLAANTLASCIEVLQRKDMGLSLIYSFLNLLPSSRADTGSSFVTPHSPPNGIEHHDSSRAATHMANRSPEERLLISCSLLHTVAILAKRFKQDDITKLALSMLLQRISSGDAAMESVILACIAELAPEAGRDMYTETVKALADFSKSVKVSEGEMSSHAIFAAHSKMATNIARSGEYCNIQMRQLLILFVDQSLPARGVVRLGTEEMRSVLAQLLDTLSLIESLIALPSYRPHYDADDEMVLLFRNLWFVAVALGLTNPSQVETDLHRTALKSIASKTPCLLRGTPLNYVETELEYNPILRREHGQSAEHLRSELSAYIPLTGAIAVRTLSYPQVVLLLSVARLECMRAELGDPSLMLSYFGNEGLNASPLLSPLQEIADKVTDAFTRSFGQRVRRHAVKQSIADSLKSMVVQCSSSSARTRSVAIRSLDAIFSVFPVLQCDAVLIRVVLESLTLLRDACESEYSTEYTPKYSYTSELAGITLTLVGDYEARNEILSAFYRHSKNWLASALAASPLEMIGLLQDYLDVDQSTELRADSGMGKAVAVEVARMMPQSAREAGLPNYGGWKADTTSAFASAFGTRHTYGSEAKTLIDLGGGAGSADVHHVNALKSQLAEVSEALRTRTRSVPCEELRPLLYRAAAVILAKEELDHQLLREIVFIPVHAVNPSAMHLGVEVWAWLVDKRADVESKLMVDLNLAWGWSIRRRRGLFSILLKAEDPINSKTEYSATDIKAIGKAFKTVRAILLPHRYLLEFLSSRFQAYRYRNRALVLGCLRTLIRSLQRFKTWGKHPLCRELRMKLLTLGFSVLNSTYLEAALERRYRSLLYAGALSWFEERPTWSYGSDRLQLQEDMLAIQRLITVVTQDVPHPAAHLSSRDHATMSLINGIDAKTPSHKQLQQLLLVHLESELQRLAVWINPLADSKKGIDPVRQTTRSLSETGWTACVRTAWAHNPKLAVLMNDRFKSTAVASEVKRLITADPAKASQVPEALHIFLGSQISSQTRPLLGHLIYWAAVSPVQVLRFFLPPFNTEPLVLQYAMRTLEQHPVDLIFFYVPQVVQALRTDPLNYMERFVFETSKISQLFCHQMIWNMKANCFKDDLAEVADPDKDIFERMVDLIVSSLSGDAKDFYEKEFGFFNEVTSISRKLMPFVKKTKPEKKAKIDEEMAKIKVEKGVYLPSHPEGKVIDIDRHSGRPLQSHAKTPFMATFKVSREMNQEYSSKAIADAGGEHTADGGQDGGLDEGFPSLQGGQSAQARTKVQESKLSAIFKVGDDCRQDVLAMQVIAQFKNMFNVFGLDLQVQPYKVLATGPGTGIIDVVPNATSRDEMGRAKINDLTQFYLFQFGATESIAFQRARNNFIQSMAAYSVLCYILQIKDRHNGNIMIDGEGRITHIDFGFLFDIGPGGIKFEPNSFKLTHEMITLMGGKTSQGYRQFCELTVKAFLSSRAYVEDVVSTCRLMMATDLPSFKGEGTMVRLRERFRPELSEREAAKYMVGVIDNACENSMSIVYDQFQYFQNKIPYAS